MTVGLHLSLGTEIKKTNKLKNNINQFLFISLFLLTFPVFCFKIMQITITIKMTSQKTGPDNPTSNLDRLIHEAEEHTKKLQAYVDSIPERRAMEARVIAAAASGQEDEAIRLYTDYLAKFCSAESLRESLAEAEANGEELNAATFRDALEKIQN